MLLPSNHPKRVELNDEVHARPSDLIGPRSRISYIVMFGELVAEPLLELCNRFGCRPPAKGVSHFVADMQGFKIRWERHTEFTRYNFSVEADESEPFSGTALANVPRDWLSSLPGELLVANHVELRSFSDIEVDEAELSRTYFSGNPIVGAYVSDGLGRAYTDFRIHSDNFGRILVCEQGMTPQQRGRIVQRLLEIDTYRMLALLAFPMARELIGPVSGFENELNEITTAMSHGTPASEPELLDRLTLLQANIVSELTNSQFRFSAAKAYSQLVGVRIDELRENRIQGLQQFSEFTERRLLPAMRTCEAVSNRLESVSERVSRATQLLSTRVDISRENQNQKLLESMDRRARLQLRLQQTVEGLSIAAISYYVVGLIAYSIAGAKALNWLPFQKEVMTMASIPIVIVVIAWAVRRAKRHLKD
ncbi:MAG: DUF3422 domain-containing protein [Pseudomonadota bacterium]